MEHSMDPPGVTLRWPNCSEIGVLFAVILPTGFPVGLIIYAFHNLELSELQVFVLSVFLVLVIALICLGIALVVETNTDSISGMVAQRYNIISYLTIVVIVAISFFSSCFVAAGGIVREQLHYDVDRPMVILGALSPLFTCMILVFPIVVSKSEFELKMNPRLDYRCFNLALCEPFVKISEGQFQFSFFPCLSEGWHKIFHFVFVGVGLVLGYVSTFMYMKTREYSSSYKWQISFLLLSIICNCFFLVIGCFQAAGNVEVRRNRDFDRVALYCEYIGLYFYMVTLIYNSILSGNLLTGGDLSEI